MGPPSSIGSLSVRIIRRIVSLCEQRGYDGRRLCQLAGIDPASLEEGELRVPYALVERLGLLAIEITHDRDFGLHLAESLRDTQSYDVGLLFLMANPTLGAALEAFVQTQHYWGDGQRAWLVPEPECVSVRHTLAGTTGDYARHAAECALAEISIGASILVGSAVAPLRVRFRHPPPLSSREHLRIFGVLPEFDQGVDELSFHRETLSLGLKSASDDFFAIFQSQVARSLAQEARGASTAADVRTAARATLARGGPALSDVARILRTSPRTLQRRLQDEGTSFFEVLEALRKEMAHEYLRRRLPVAEVAALLGYGDATAFCHAFRRWTGRPPLDTRSGPSA